MGIRSWTRRAKNRRRKARGGERSWVRLEARGPVFETLEARLLLAADLIAALDDAGGAQTSEPWPSGHTAAEPALVSAWYQSDGDRYVLAAPEARPERFQPSVFPEALDSLGLLDPSVTGSQDRAAPSNFDTESLTASVAARYELVIVDARIEDYESLVSDLLSQRSESLRMEVHVLDADRDGIDGVSEILSRHSEVDAVHVMSHGDERGLQLGATWLDTGALIQRAGAIQAWGNALTEDADLLLYGCNLAATAEGELLLGALGRLTGADVAASSDLTGSASLGGDWTLEHSTGAIEAAIAFENRFVTQWQGVLARITVGTTIDDVNGDTTTIGDLIATPGGDGISLREAVIAANATPGADEIILGPGVYTLTYGAAFEDFALGRDLDIRDDLTLTGADSSTTIIDGNAGDRVFHLHGTATVDISGVTVRNGGGVASGAGIYVTSGTQLDLSDSIVAGNMGNVGSGIRNDGTLTLTDVSLSGNGNGSTSIGGGLANSMFADAILNRVTVSGNQADTGGGIHNQNNAISLSLINVTLSGNAATSVGGGLFSRESLTVTNSTVTANSASGGGGVAISGGGSDVFMTNTIVAANTDSGTAPDFMGGTIRSQGFNLIGNTTGTTGVFVGTDKLDVAAGLDPTLAHNGGPTRTHALLTGSVAINGGTTAGAPSLDQRGLARDGSPDIGAFETHVAPSLWVSTDGDVGAGNGVPGMNATPWQEGDLLAMGDPNLAFGEGSTDGTFSLAFDVELFSPGAEINAMHYVSRTLTLGDTYTFGLKSGDLILSARGPGTTTLVSNGATPEADLDVGAADVFVFRPDTAGNYAVGNFYMLLEDPLGHGIRALSLVERDTWVGDMWLRAGDFLLSRSGPSDHSDVKLYEVTDVEDTSGTRTTSGTVTTLLDGSDGNVAIDEQIYGLELLEDTLTIGNTTLNAGTILMQLNNGESLGENNISVSKHDALSVVVNQTTLGSGSGDITVAKFIDGSGVQLNTNEELIDGLALTPTAAPVVNTSPEGIADAYTVNEDTALDSNDAWFDSNWSSRRTLSFDNAGRGQNLNDFPVLVTLDATRIDYGQTQNGGEDLRFVDGDGTVLAHEIEEWDELGTSYVWVKVPQIDASSGKDFIWMYYGNGSAGNGENPAAVWSNAYQAVYHLEQDPGAGGTLSDSTGTFDGANAGSTDAAARIGRGQSFNGSSDYIDMGLNQPFLNNASGATVSGWIQADATAIGNVLGASIAGGPTSSSRVTLNLDADKVYLSAISDDVEAHQTVETTAGLINTGSWYHLTGVVDYATGDMTIYVDGVERAHTTVAFNAAATPGTDSWGGAIGANEDGGSRWFDGILDEIRLSDAARSAQWVAAQYASTTDTFITYGYEQTVAGVLGNDIDSEGDALTAALVTGPVNAAAFALNPNGSFTYTPAANFNGVDTFQYRANDGSANSGLVTVTITVNAVNDTPAAVADSASTPEDTAVTTGNVLGNDDLGDQPTTITAFDAVSANGGAVVNNGDGTFTYTPAADFNGSDSFTYTITDDDSETSTATVTITVNAVNDTPAAVADSASTPEDTAVTTGNVLSNDDLGDQPTTITAFDAVSANGGAVVNNGDGTFTYTPAADFNGSDTFTYTITDDDSETSTATVTITVNAVNDTPAAVADSASTPEDTAVTTGNVLSNDDLGDRPTTITAFDAVSANGGTVGNNLDGTFTYTPAGNFNGSDSFTYTITDDDGETSTATVTITVTAVNDVPVAIADSASTPEDTAVTTGNVLGNDNLGDQPTTISAFDAASANGATVVNNGDGTFTYTPAVNFNGSDSFTYTIRDSDGETSTATVTITVNAVNDTPAAVADSASTPENTAVTTGNVLSNDDQGDEPTTISAFDAASVNGGTVVDNGDGTFTYTPALNFTGLDSFTYTIRDSDGETSTTTVTVTVTGSNVVPVAVDDSAATVEDTAVTTGNVLANDNLGNEPTTITAFDAVSANGATVVNNADGTFTYLPLANFNGSDSFTYTITDVDGEGSTATVTVTVSAANDAPLAAGDNYRVDQGGVLRIPAAGVLINDSDPETDPLTAILVSGPTDGTLVLGTDGAFVYTPDAGFTGSDSFVYRANDGTDDSGQAVVLVTVEPVASVTAEPPDTGDPVDDVDTLVPSPPLPEPPSVDVPDPGGNPLDTNPAGPADSPPIAGEGSEPFDPSTLITRGAGGGSPAATSAEEPAPDAEEVPVTETPAEDTTSDTAAPAPVVEAAKPDSAGSADNRETRIADLERKLSFLRGDSGFTEALNSVRQSVEDDIVIDEVAIGSGVVMATGLSVGYVAWMTRGGLLLLSLVSSMPAWRLVDPIPVLGSLRNKRDDEDDTSESLRSIIEGQSPDNSSDDSPQPDQAENSEPDQTLTDSDGGADSIQKDHDASPSNDDEGREAPSDGER